MKNVIKKIENIIYKLILKLIDSPIKPRETILSKETKEKLLSIRNDNLMLGNEWKINTHLLYNNVINNNVCSFLRWDIILKTMFVSNFPYIKKELNYLKSHYLWEDWSRAIIETKTGDPIPSIFYPKSSGNLIHQTYHLAQYKEKTGIDFNNIELVFEFGGGYGSMCLLLNRLGFNGNYLIYDIPHFSVLQEYYLKSNSIKNFYCFSDISKLKQKISNNAKSLFIATWSLSEVPLDLRNKIVSIINDFDYILIAYQNEFDGIDNNLYFNNFKDNFKNMSWDELEIEHLPKNKYLMGKNATHPQNQT